MRCFTMLCLPSDSIRRWQLCLGWKAWAAIVNGEFLGGTCCSYSCADVATTTTHVSSSFSEVVDILLRPPVESSSVDEVNLALAALAMLPVTVRRLSLACKSGDPHPRFSLLCPTKLISFARLASPDNIDDAGAAHLAAFSNLTSLDLYNNKIGDAGAAHLAAISDLTCGWSTMYHC